VGSRRAEGGSKKGMKGLRIALVSFVLIGAMVALHLSGVGGGRWGTAPVPAAAGSAFSGTVEEVVDGDTLRLAGGVRVRLLGLDAPERGQPLHAEAGECFRSLAAGRRVRLVVGEERPVDGYGRTLALVYADDLLLNEELLARGLARAYFRSEKDLPQEVARRLVLAQCRSIDRRLGLWGLPNALTTAPGERLVETRFRFHRVMCPALADTARRRGPVTREAALRAGKSPCRTCNPRKRRRRAPHCHCNGAGLRPR